MAGSIFGIPLKPVAGQGVVWNEGLGGRMDLGNETPTAGNLTGLTLNRVPFGTTTGGLQDSANLTFDGTTLALTGAQTISTTLLVTGLATLTAGLTTPAAIVSTLATGTAPFTVASTTVVANLNASALGGATFAAPGAIGGGTPSTGAFTTLSATGVITSTLATGTAPFTVASTTQVTNLNASQLIGGTWAIPGSIGATTPAAGAFTTLGATGVSTLQGNLLVGTTTNPGGNFRAQITSPVAKATSTTHSVMGMGSNDSPGSTDLGFFFRLGCHATAGSRWAGLQSYENSFGARLFVLQDLGGNVAIGSTTDDGANALQVTGGIKLTGALTLGNAYVGTPQVTTGYVTIKDSGGTTYKVLVAT